MHVSETSPNPPPPAPPYGPVLPTIDPAALAATALAVVSNPSEFFKAIKHEEGYTKCLVFSVAAAAVYGALLSISTFLSGLGVGLGFAIGAAIRALIAAVILGGLLGPFVGGIVVWGASLVFGSKAPHPPSIRIAAYSSALLPALGLAHFLSFVPFVYPLAKLALAAYAIYVAVMGARVLNFEAPGAPTKTA